jgi:hypothetical protein
MPSEHDEDPSDVVISGLYAPGSNIVPSTLPQLPPLDPGEPLSETIITGLEDTEVSGG